MFYATIRALRLTVKFITLRDTKKSPKTLVSVGTLCYAVIMTKEQMLAEYDVLGFALGMCVVRRKSDGVKGTLFFEGNPRVYYDFQEA